MMENDAGPGLVAWIVVTPICVSVAKRIIAEEIFNKFLSHRKDLKWRIYKLKLFKIFDTEYYGQVKFWGFWWNAAFWGADKDALARSMISDGYDPNNRVGK